VLLAFVRSTVRTIQEVANENYSWILDDEPITNSNPGKQAFQGALPSSSSSNSLSTRASSSTSPITKSIPPNDAFSLILLKEIMSNSNVPSFGSRMPPPSSVDSPSTSSSSSDSNVPTINSVPTGSEFDLIKSASQPATFESARRLISNTMPNAIRLRNPSDRRKFFLGQVKNSKTILSIPDQIEVPIVWRTGKRRACNFRDKEIHADDFVVFTIGIHFGKVEAKLIYLREDWEAEFQTKICFPDEMDRFCFKILEGVFSYKQGHPMVTTILGERLKHLNVLSIIGGKKIQKGDKVTFRLIRSENDFFAKDVKLWKKFV